MSQAILIVEYSSISYGMGVLDRLVKQSAITPLYAKPVCVGKFLMLLAGEVQDLRESQKVLAQLGEERLVGTFLLTAAHRDILQYFHKKLNRKEQYMGVEAIAIFETRNIASGIFSLDAALKCGSVKLVKLSLGHYTGGKCYYILAGSVSDVQQATAQARGVIPEKTFVGCEVIPSPDVLTLEMLLDGYAAMRAQ